MQSKAKTVAEYLALLPPDRREIIEAIRGTILEHLPEGYEEGMQFGMISYSVPLGRYPNTYNGQPLGYIALASQKNYVSLYLMGIYGNPEAEAWLKKAFVEAGKRLDMGKSCLRFKKAVDVPQDIIAKAVALLPVEAFIKRYEASRG
jgi:uncharacterized protein YdhG (YjbR/CyaY superfamily)